MICALQLKVVTASASHAAKGCLERKPVPRKGVGVRGEFLRFIRLLVSPADVMGKICGAFYRFGPNSPTLMGLIAHPYGWKTGSARRTGPTGKGATGSILRSNPASPFSEQPVPRSAASQSLPIPPNASPTRTRHPERSLPDRQEPALTQSREYPSVFVNQLIHHAPLFEFRRQHFPGVSLHLKMPALLGIPA
jgi:hypothetical protein